MYYSTLCDTCQFIFYSLFMLTVYAAVCQLVTRLGPRQAVRAFSPVLFLFKGHEAVWLFFDSSQRRPSGNYTKSTHLKTAKIQRHTSQPACFNCGSHLSFTDSKNSSPSQLCSYHAVHVSFCSWFTSECGQAQFLYTGFQSSSTKHKCYSRVQVLMMKSCNS